MIKKIILLFSGLLILVDLSAIIDIAPYLQKYKFNTGSYWVYEEENTNTIDSITVENVIHKIETIVAGGHGEIYWINQYECFFIYYQSHTLNYKTWDKIIFTYILIKGKNFFDGFIGLGIDYIDETIPFYRVDELEFTNVKKVIIPSGFYNGNDIIYYYVENVGIVRKEEYIPGTDTLVGIWDLKKWEVTIDETLTTKNIESEGFDIYPNPVKDYFYLKIPADNLGKINVKIFDLNGNLIQQFFIANVKNRIDISELSSGAYIVEIITDKQRSMSKIIKSQ